MITVFAFVLGMILFIRVQLSTIWFLRLLARMHGHFRTCNGVLSTRSCYNFLKIARVAVSYLLPYWCLCPCPCILGYWLQQIVPTLDHFVLLGEFGAFNVRKGKNFCNICLERYIGFNKQRLRKKRNFEFIFSVSLAC